MVKSCSQSQMVPQNLRTQSVELVAVAQTLQGAFFSISLLRSDCRVSTQARSRTLKTTLSGIVTLEFKLSQHLLRFLRRLLKEVAYKLQISSDSKSCSLLTISKMSLVLDLRHMNNHTNIMFMIVAHLEPRFRTLCQ